MFRHAPYVVAFSSTGIPERGSAREKAESFFLPVGPMLYINQFFTVALYFALYHTTTYNIRP